MSTVPDGKLTIQRVNWTGLGELYQEQWLPISLDEAWDFFSRPSNLNAITPEHLQFKMHSEDRPIYAGQLLRYRIRLAPLVWTTWITEITAVEPGVYFIDEQRAGPYSFWYHEHRFEERDGGVLMSDRVTFRVPGWCFASIPQLLYIHGQLQTIFGYRFSILEQKFPTVSTAA